MCCSSHDPFFIIKTCEVVLTANLCYQIIAELMVANRIYSQGCHSGGTFQRADYMLHEGRSLLDDNKNLMFFVPGKKSVKFVLIRGNPWTKFVQFV
jgi:hypothetical protein